MLKIAFGENPNYKRPEDVSPNHNRILPVNFNANHKEMLSHLYTLANKEYLAIPEKFDKLIVSLQTAWAQDYSLDKEQTSYNDLLYALRLFKRVQDNLVKSTKGSPYFYTKDI